jgi:hypothetical protein
MKQTYRHKTIVGLSSLICCGFSYSNEQIIQAPEQSIFSGILGHFGAASGLNAIREVNTGGQDQDSISFTTLEGSITLPVASKWLVSLDAIFRYDDFSSSSDFDNENPEWEYTLGSHLLYQFTPDTRAGLILGYGDTRNNGATSSESYDTWLVGGEIQHFVTDDLMVYAQLGTAFKGRDGQDSDEGFNDGFFARAGSVYFFNDRSSINFDIEAAGCQNYIDSTDPGRFFGFTLSYQQQVLDDTPLYFSAFGRYDHINSTDEGNSVDEWQVGIGFRYYFGAGSQKDANRKGASIGMPRLATRASAWTEYMD